jgi:hypothetical protein
MTPAVFNGGADSLPAFHRQSFAFPAHLARLCGQSRSLCVEIPHRVTLSNHPAIASLSPIELILRQPYCKIAFVVDAGLAERKTASEYLRELERIGILAGEKIGRERIYRHPALLNALSA